MAQDWVAVTHDARCMVSPVQRRLSFKLLIHLYSHTVQLSRGFSAQLVPGVLRELHTCSGVNLGCLALRLWDSVLRTGTGDGNMQISATSLDSEGK